MKQQENIKDQNYRSKIKDTFQKSKILNFLFVILLFAFLFLNLVFSQLISPYFFGFVNNDRAATINFLHKIKDLPDYQNILRMHDNIYGKSIRAEINSEENKKKALINNLEQQLTINLKARDILYSLYQLYLAKGDKNKAADYLRRAKEVDPNVN
ncbi:MAG: hypothetical protein NUV87_03265 [Candidatus Roizmanbacteria bacterium]|nr:hypothetical protein [Candidatus Roizmanbacteria bacterium]MCR4312891.1 hypothetical protein [Candidatus Roizmanbacteria bacterium]